MEKASEGGKIPFAKRVKIEQNRMKNMRICMICPEMGNSGGSAFIGGHVNNVIQLSKALSNNGHEITILTTPHRHPGNEYVNNMVWAEVVSLPIYGSYPSVKYGLEFFSKTLLKLRMLNKTKNFDIIHGHSGYSMLGLITGIGGKIVGVPSVHSVYSPIQPTVSYNSVMTFSNKRLSKFCLSQVSKVVAVTSNVQESLRMAGISDRKLALIAPCIDTCMYNPNTSGIEIRRQFNIKSNETLLLYVGNLTKIKGIQVLIEAFKIIVKRFPDTKLLIALNMPLIKYESEASDGLYYTENGFEIKEMIKFYGLNKKIITLGIMNNMPQIVAASDIFIVPFLNTVGVADYPISMLEAMASGKPVVATKIGGIPEIVKHGKYGMLVEPNNVNELVDGIAFMLDNKEKVKYMGRNCADMISKGMGLEIAVKKVEDIYHEVIYDYNSN